MLELHLLGQVRLLLDGAEIRVAKRNVTVPMLAPPRGQRRGPRTEIKERTYMLYRNAVLALTLLAVPVGAAAAPTPVPGGANQVSAMSGKVGETIFNGVLRIKIANIRDATAADNPGQMNAQPNQKVMVMSVLLRNGSHETFTDLVEYTLADKDDVSYSIPNSTVTHANLHIAQGAAARQEAMFVVDRDFVPVKVLAACVTCGTKSPFRTVRFSIP
ncbi:MAG: hypothetical protein ABI282_09475 [Candidatus Baltobacteraceae bacterium]